MGKEKARGSVFDVRGSMFGLRRYDPNNADKASKNEEAAKMLYP
jgi:hypothetical protein